MLPCRGFALPPPTRALFPQTWLLFHNALSEGVVIDDILKYARMNKEQAHKEEDSLEDDQQLRTLVQAQATELELLKKRVSRAERRLNSFFSYTKETSS